MGQSTQSYIALTPHAQMKYLVNKLELTVSSLNALAARIENHAVEDQTIKIFRQIRSLRKAVKKGK